jgi:hypothetical protein
MIERGFLPAALDVTCIAHRPVLALVNVIPFMAVDAKVRQLVGEPPALVTTHALGLFVPTQQGRLGLRVMIEDHFLPVFLDMTGFAFGSKAAFVFIVLLVAGGTCSLQLAFGPVALVTP